MAAQCNHLASGNFEVKVLKHFLLPKKKKSVNKLNLNFWSVYACVRLYAYMQNKPVQGELGMKIARRAAQSRLQYCRALNLPVLEAGKKNYLSKGEMETWSKTVQACLDGNCRFPVNKLKYSRASASTTDNLFSIRKKGEKKMENEEIKRTSKGRRRKSKRASGQGCYRMHKHEPDQRPPTFGSASARWSARTQESSSNHQQSICSCLHEKKVVNQLILKFF